MIGSSRAGQRSQWVQALAASLILHGAAIGGILYDGPTRAPTTPGGVTQISVETLTPSAISADVVTPEAQGTSEPTPLPATTPTVTPEAFSTDTGAARPVTTQEASIVTTGTGQWSVVIPPMPELPPMQPGSRIEAPPDPLPQGGAAGGEPVDPQLADMIGRIRDRLDEACLLALPMLPGDGGLQLDVVAADDRQIGDFVRDVTAGLADEVPDRSVLVDSRQCAGLTFARRAADYPVFGLSIQLQASDVDSGGSISGRIANGAGHYNTLLMVDDNGVVHDLRRFLVVQGGEVTFDVPVARAGAGRDTNQLLIAIATTGRIDSVTANAGQLAADFFPALIAEIGEQVLIGVGSVYIR